ncbi:MAG TPA: sigma 54-interacting transcriptional regulator [Polyangia bacterium]|jgi:transcriptional regulator with GAF, ATPase, and Fis domain
MPDPHDSATRVVPGSRALRVRRVRLEVRQGPDAGLARDFDSDRIVLGTAPGTDLTLTDREVSRHHCEIQLGPDGYLLRDLGSTNGTFVEGLRAREVFLRDGAGLELGATRLAFRALADEAEIELCADDRFGGLIGVSAGMRRVFATLAKIAPRDVTALVTGESGTGKELVAQALHRASARSGGPFIVVDCGAMPATLMENEIFGHERGAFTGADRARAGAFERADGGTLFFDEIGELPLELQPKLLRALEGREVARLGGGAPRKVDVRVVAATNRDLRAEVNRGGFRGDLFYRLSVVEVRLPPLRERPEDVPALVRHFLDEAARRAGGGADYQLGPRTLERLQRHRWPGNVRELRNFVERSVSLAEGALIDGTLTGLEAPAAPPAAPAPADAVAPAALLTLPFKAAKRLFTEPFERAYLEALLARVGGNVSKAAREADLDRAYLTQILKKYDLK